MFGNAVIYRLTSGSVFYPLPAQIKKTQQIHYINCKFTFEIERIASRYHMDWFAAWTVQWISVTIESLLQKKTANKHKGILLLHEIRIYHVLYVSILCQREQKNQYNHNKIPNMKLYKHLKPLLYIIYFHLF